MKRILAQFLWGLMMGAATVASIVVLWLSFLHYLKGSG